MISRYDLPMVIPVRTIRSIDFKSDSVEEFLMTNLYMKSSMNEPNFLDFNGMTDFISQIEGHHHNPFIQAIYFFRQAFRLLHAGRHNEVIVNIQTSIEMFFTTMLFQILSHEAKRSKSEIDNIVNGAYAKVLNHHLSKYFNGVRCVFSFKEEDDEDEKNLLLNYRKDIYQKRNDIVHQGCIFSEEDAFRAYETANEIFKNVTKVINTTDLKQLVYPPEFHEIHLLR